MTQIMNLLRVAPDIQEALMFLPAVENRRERFDTKLATKAMRKGLRDWSG